MLPVPVADRLQWGSKPRHPGIQRGSDAQFLPLLGLVTAGLSPKTLSLLNPGQDGSCPGSQ